MAKQDTEQQAVMLLDKIRNYWAARGYKVEGNIYPSGYSERLRSTVYEVRTNLCNGRPRHRIH